LRAKIWPLFLVLLLGLCGAFFLLSYEEAKDVAIETLDKEQSLHARQAALGIEEFFRNWEGTLTALSRIPDIAEMNDHGTAFMEFFYETHEAQINGVTRTDENGVIVFTVPNKGSIGKDISYQPHVREIMARRTPVVSDVFRAVQGFDAVAIHVPVLRDGAYDGSIAVTINFQKLAQRFFEVIRVGETGYAWVISRDGTELYSPVPGHTGHAIFENFRDSPSVLALAKEMQAGRSGKAVYDFKKGGDPASAPVRKRAVYMPIDLGNTFWSVAVATPKREALSSLAALRNRLALITISIFCCGAFLAFFGLKAWIILKEEKMRRRAEEALRLSEEKFAKAFRASPDSLVITRLADGRIQEINDGFTRVTGFSTDEALGRTTLELALWAVPEERTRHIEQLRASGCASGQEAVLCMKSGERRTGIISSEVIEVNGEPCALSVIRDITESKQQGIERQRLQDQLLQSIKMESLGRLAGGIAHDFNNLLTAIMGNASLALLDLDEKSPVAVQLREVIQAADSASALTRQLLAFSRRQIIEPKIQRLNDLINNLNKLMIRIIGEDVELRVRLDAEPSTVRIDPGQFEQVLLNLAVNARDAMPDGGQLMFETANVVLDEEYCSAHPTVRPGRFVMLTVRDTGHGMTDTVKQRIFEPFFTTKPQGRGTGLGLAMVFGAVTQAEGTVEVGSEPEKGTTFRIFLPQVQAVAEEIAKADVSARLERGTETILLVEDDLAVRELVRATLRMLGYTILEAQNGAEAIELVNRETSHIHLLLTDVVLPGMNGRELAERLLKTRPAMRILYTSGYTEDVIVHHGVVDAGLNFIGKPHTPRALAKKVRQVLDGVA